MRKQKQSYQQGCLEIIRIDIRDHDLYNEHCSVWEECRMNKTVTSKEDILSVSRELAAEKGIQEINMRSVAARCGFAVGSVYNYFSSKNDLMIAVIDSIWNEIMQGIADCQTSLCFTKKVESLFYGVKSCGEKYPLFFSIHSMSIAKSGKEKGRETMNQYFECIKADLLNCLREDINVKQTFFSKKCTQEDFVAFVFANVLSLLMQGQDSCDVLIELIKGAVYD